MLTHYYNTEENIMLLKKNQTIAYYGGAKNLGIIDKDDEVLELL